VIKKLNDRFMKMVEALPWDQRLKLLSMANVKYIVHSSRLDPLPLERVFETEDVVDPNDPEGRFKLQHLNLYLNPQWLPRTFLVPECRYAGNDRQATELLMKEDFDPEKVVVLEDGNPVACTPLPKDLNPKLPPVRIQSRTPAEVVVATQSTTSSWLLLTDSFYPGWEAEVDGNPAALYRANLIFRAVALAPGQHEVRFVYRPWTFRYGRMLALSTLLILAGWLVFSIQRAGSALPPEPREV
jgi:hypothetical protein